MQKIANDFWTKNRGKGVVDKVTDYSFVWTTNPNKEGKTSTIVYYMSYFVKLSCDKGD